MHIYTCFKKNTFKLTMTVILLVKHNMYVLIIYILDENLDE